MDNYIKPADTTIEAARVQFDVLQRLDISERANMTFQLSNNLRRITEAGVRLRHPDYDDETVKLAVLRLTLGDDLFGEAFGNIEVEV